MEIVQNDLKQNNKFISNTFRKALWPCMLSILSANINVIVDGILVAQKIGSSALAAINLCMPVFLFMCVIGSFIASGTSINASKAIGSGSDYIGNEYYKVSVVLTFVVSLIVTILGFLFLHNIVAFLCSDRSIKPFVQDYTFIAIAGTLPKVMIYIPFWYLRLDGRNREVSIMMSILTLGNIILDIIFVYIINWGVFGAGFASVLATSIAFAYGAASMQDKISSFRFTLKIDYKRIKWKKICTAGIPSSFNNLCATIRIIVINTILLSIGGGALVAMFTALNGVYGIGECIVLGIPQAATAMLGVYCGEKDNKSCEIILKGEMLIGLILTAGFSAIVLVSTPFLNKIYGLEANMFIPLVWLCLSIFPALLCNAMSGYYNIHNKNTLSILIIALRVVIMTYIGLMISVKTGISIFSFLFFAEIITVLILYIITGIIYLNNKDLHRYMLCNMKHESEGKVLNFSIEPDDEAICNGCEQINVFCENNGLSPKETMRIQLGMEEAMTLVNKVNTNVSELFSGFDLRVFNINNIIGIRIRYDGVDFNPFNNPDSSDDYMGIRMVADMFETSNYQRTFGVNTLILLLKEKQ